MHLCCLKCTSVLDKTRIDDVEVDHCPACGGLWLDHGEIERLSRKMAPVLRRLYDQMPEPKWVIAMGDCASCSGVFNNYALMQGVDEVVPVDVYVAGCPPRPEALIHGVVTLYEKVKGDKFKDVVVQK